MWFAVVALASLVSFVVIFHEQHALLTLLQSMMGIWYHTVVLYLGIIQVWDFLPQNITQKPA